ncbi:MAG: nucleotidyltransferase family protein [Gammaproteobacteria bacterium]|nr:nucleotidyltransferase family protein [Gammaproteobacteria bacterium]
MNGSLAGILLAAGQGRRFGGNKLLHRLNDSDTVLSAAVNNLANVLPDTVVVISPEMVGQSAGLESLGARVVVNDLACQGMAGSIVRGVQASADASGWLVALADMPWIQSQTIALLVDRFESVDDIVAPVYEQQRGHPVVFGSGYRDELLVLTGDAGAKPVLDRHAQHLKLVPVNDRGVLLDIDYREDLGAVTGADRNHPASA